VDTEHQRDLGGRPGRFDGLNGASGLEVGRVNLGKVSAAASDQLNAAAAIAQQRPPAVAERIGQTMPSHILP